MILLPGSLLSIYRVISLSSDFPVFCVSGNSNHILLSVVAPGDVTVLKTPGDKCFLEFGSKGNEHLTVPFLFVLCLCCDVAMVNERDEVLSLRDFLIYFGNDMNHIITQISI